MRPPTCPRFPYTTLFRSGVLSGAGFSVPEPGPDHQGAWVLALDVEHYLPLERFAADVERLLAYVRSASRRDRKSTRLNSSHGSISYAVFCLKKKNTLTND